MVTVRFKEWGLDDELPPISQCAKIFNLIVGVDDKNLSDYSCTSLLLNIVSRFSRISYLRQELPDSVT